MNKGKCAILLTIFLSSASLVWCGQETISTTISVPSQKRLDSTSFSVAVNGKSATVTMLTPVAVLPVADKADELTSVPPEQITSPTIFVFDVMDSRALDERDMRKIVLRYLTDAANRKEAVGLMVMKLDGLKMVHDYRNGSAVLAAAMAAVNGSSSPAVPGAERILAEETRRLRDFAKGADANPIPDGQLLRTSIDAPIYMMQDVAASMVGVSGRKAIVWITSGVPFEILEDDHSLTSHLEDTSGPSVAGARVSTTRRILNEDQVKKLQPAWRATLNALMQSGTAVYPVEAHGAFGVPPGIVFTSTMNTLANMTGGRAAYGTNNPTPFFKSIADENANAYALNLTYDRGRNDWQKLAITVSQSTKVVAASGFFPSPPLVPDEVRKNAIGQSLNSPMSYSGLPCRLTFGEQSESGGKKSVKFAIFLPPEAGVADPRAGEISVDIAAVAFTSDRRRAGSMSAAAGGKLPVEALKQISETGVNISKTIDLAPGDYTLRVVVRDNMTGRMGSINAPLKVL
jgi:VWFA-related protein